MLGELRTASLNGSRRCGPHLNSSTARISASQTSARRSQAEHNLKDHILATILRSLDLRKGEGLESVIHAGPSTIGIDTVVASNGEIPEISQFGLLLVSARTINQTFLNREPCQVRDTPGTEFRHEAATMKFDGLH